MNGERARFEMLLEEIRDQVKLLAEGQSAIHSGMERMKEHLSGKINSLDLKIDRVHSSLKNELNVTYMALNEKIEDHVKQPSHAA